MTMTPGRRSNGQKIVEALTLNPPYPKFFTHPNSDLREPYISF